MKILNHWKYLNYTVLYSNWYLQMSHTTFNKNFWVIRMSGPFLIMTFAMTLILLLLLLDIAQLAMILCICIIHWTKIGVLGCYSTSLLFYFFYLDLPYDIGWDMSHCVLKLTLHLTLNWLPLSLHSHSCCSR